jgi:hypothetical protein
LGLWRKIPMPAHLGLDGATGALMGLSAVWLRGAGLGNWLPFALLAPGEIAGAALTARRPGDRPSPGQAAVGSMTATDTGAGGPAAAEGVGTGGPAPDPLSDAASGVTGEGLAARDPGSGGASVAPAPLETPGPSVTPPALPESDTERAERVDASLPANEAGDDLVAEQEAAAAAEAAAIGGPTGTQTGDPAMDPVYEAGGGEQEGFEAAEDDLIENATHGDGHGEPERDAIAPELEADRSTAVYGETDTLPSTEVTDDPSTSGDDPGEGPGLAADRGPGPAPKQP